ncbi:WGxxGxxG-CTERM domain-containing protein [Bacillus toyonensis]|nr:WGxxGxxG-CTERM domain-containing protein [Bacillus toyonensis]
MKKKLTSILGALLLTITVFGTTWLGLLGLLGLFGLRKKDKDPETR